MSVTAQQKIAELDAVIATLPDRVASDGNQTMKEALTLLRDSIIADPDAWEAAELIRITEAESQRAAMEAALAWMEASANGN